LFINYAPQVRWPRILKGNPERQLFVREDQNKHVDKENSSYDTWRGAHGYRLK